MSQLSLFGATARSPRIEDLDGLLAGTAQAVRREAVSRISVVVASEWRAAALARELSDRLALTADLAATEGGTTVRTPWLEQLRPVADAWTHGAVKAPPAGWVLDGPRLRWWCLAEGVAAPGMYTLALGASDQHAWVRIGSALAVAGVPGVLVGPRADGPAYRIVGRRRLTRLLELIGEPPSELACEAWPSLS
jgi:hypothetical protein